MPKKAFTLVEIMVTVAIITLLTLIAIPNLIRARILANDVLAQTALRNIATAMETYNHQNHRYPPAMSELTNITPPYLSKDYFSGTTYGFAYATITLTTDTYAVSASPVNLGTTGTTTYTITTGGVLQ